MSNSLDPDQARRFVGPDLGPNCLPRLSADDTGRQRVKVDPCDKDVWRSHACSLMWMMLLHLHVNLNADDDDDV